MTATAGPAGSDTFYMEMALAAAGEAGAAGDVPVGAVVVVDGTVIATACNRREADQDPTAHAELLALRAAAAALESWRLTSAVMYVTLEPCPMCAGAVVAARLGRLVFGAPDPKAGACGSLYNLCADPRLNHELAVTPGVLQDRSAALLRDWFALQRAGGE